MEPYFVSIVAWGEDPYDHNCGVCSELHRFDFRDRANTLRDYINIYTDRVKCEQYAWFSIQVVDVRNGECFALIQIANPLRERKQLNIAARELQKKAPAKKQISLEQMLDQYSSPPAGVFTQALSVMISDGGDVVEEEDAEEHDTHGGMPPAYSSIPEVQF